MTPAQQEAKLNELLALPQETEWAEFKHNNSDPQMIGEYLSALSNSAALEEQPFGYIVWGVEDGTRNIVGTAFKPRSQKGAGNEDLEPWLNKLLAPKVNVRIFEFEDKRAPDGDVRDPGSEYISRSLRWSSLCTCWQSQKATRRASGTGTRIVVALVGADPRLVGKSVLGPRCTISIRTPLHLPVRNARRSIRLWPPKWTAGTT